jgi:hypothetical protein
MVGNYGWKFGKTKGGNEMYDEDYAEKLKRLESILREHWSVLSCGLQNEIESLNEEYE